MAKPKPYDEAVAQVICERIIEGQSLREICRDPDMPGKDTVYKWLAVTPTFADAYTRAREHQCDAWADDMREIADDATNDYMERIGKDGVSERVPDPETVQRSKLRIDTLKWLMSKYSPKRFGDRIDVNMSATVEVGVIPDAELEARTRARLAALGRRHLYRARRVVARPAP